MLRVLKPGGKFVMATWCQRDDRKLEFSEKDKKDLKFLYEEWTHPMFISIEKYKELIEGEGGGGMGGGGWGMDFVNSFVNTCVNWRG